MAVGSSMIPGISGLCNWVGRDAFHQDGDLEKQGSGEHAMVTWRARAHLEGDS